MREGYFLGRNGRAVQVRDHESDLRGDHSLLASLGVPASRVSEADSKHPSDRESFLTEILKHGPARFREHGYYATVEFWSAADSCAPPTGSTNTSITESVTPSSSLVGIDSSSESVP